MEFSKLQILYCFIVVFLKITSDLQRTTNVHYATLREP